VLVRYSREDPWESLDLWRTWLPSSELRSPVCQNRIGTFGMTPDALMDLWVRTLVRHGIDALWVYDCLYNMAGSPARRWSTTRSSTATSCPAA